MKKRTLTEVEWLRVFEIRCASKRGQAITDLERDLIRRACEEDRTRYVAMNDAVFEATMPFGSTSRVKREKEGG